jgi:hypothetical protein
MARTGRETKGIGNAERKTIERLKKLSPMAPHLRDQHLKARIATAQSNDDEKAAKGIREIRNREKRKWMHNKVKKYMSPEKMQGAPLDSQSPRQRRAEGGDRSRGTGRPIDETRNQELRGC